MRTLFLTALLTLSLLVPVRPGDAQPTSQVTATCKDGSTFTGATRSGACRGHGGVKSWEAAATGAAPTSPTAGPAAKAPTAGGAGQVWVNTATKVYHCPGTRWYGKTKQGAYMSEAAAKAEGARPDHGKVCSS